MSGQTGLRAAVYAEAATSAGARTRWRLTTSSAVGLVDSLIVTDLSVAAQLPVTTPIYTVAAGAALIPDASTLAGARAMVSDSNATLAAGHGDIVATGGAFIVPVYSDGTNWRIG